jgi:hypothetical protein
MDQGLRVGIDDLSDQCLCKVDIKPWLFSKGLRIWRWILVNWNLTNTKRERARERAWVSAAQRQRRCPRSAGNLSPAYFSASGGLVGFLMFRRQLSGVLVLVS